MPLHIHPRIAAKIAGDEHGNVTLEDVEQCFENHGDGFCTDSRPHHAAHDGTLPTLWFVGVTNRNRRLKIVFVRDGDDIYLKTAYLASAEIERIYRKYRSA